MYLSRLIGCGRTFEYVFASKDIDAATADRYGWINRAFPTSAELRAYVQQLAARIAFFPPGAIAGTKQGINVLTRPPMDLLIQDAQNVIGVLAATLVSLALSENFIKATHNQSLGDLELNYGTDLESLFK
jgi:enoyl-CoA hydratase/carnithine racemase